MGARGGKRSGDGRFENVNRLPSREGLPFSAFLYGWLVNRQTSQTLLSSMG